MKRNINDQIVDILRPKEIEDPEQADIDETTAAKLSVFDEQDVEGIGKSLMSDFRKRNVSDVTKSDKKYKGQAVSRAELNDFLESSEEEGEDDGEKYATDTDDEEVGGEEPDEEEEEESDQENEAQSQEEEDFDSEDEEEDTDEIKPSQILRPEIQGEKVRQGKAVKVQLQLWEKLLEMRIKSQKLLTLANSLPFGTTFDSLNKNSEFSEAISSTTDVILSLLDKNRDLQKNLVEQFPESKEIPKATRKRKFKSNESLEAKRAHIDHIWDDLNSFTSNYTPYRNSVIQKWHDRTKIATNVKSLKTMENQSVVQKIDNILLNRNDLIRKTQIYRGGYEIIGHAIENAAAAEVALEVPHENASFEIPLKKDTNIYVSEIYDDSDFYHQLLRELIEFKTSTSNNPQELEQKYQELHQLRKGMKKSVDTRASKGRKIRYVVHNKLVNFMAPVPDDDKWTEETKTELYNSLFDKLMTQVEVL